MLLQKAYRRSTGWVRAVAVNSFQELIDAVNFPRFVAGLINGVFDAIVDSSIEQMRAYGELLKDVAKTVDQFLQENVSDDDGRDYLAERYPEYFEVDETRCLRLRDGIDRRHATTRLHRLVPDGRLNTLDAASVKRILIPAARRRIAANRQQLLASMVLMGIQRIDTARGRAGRAGLPT